MEFYGECVECNGNANYHLAKYSSKDKENNNQNTLEINLNVDYIKVNNEIKFGNVNLVNVGTIYIGELFQEAWCITK